MFADPTKKFDSAFLSNYYNYTKKLVCLWNGRLNCWSLYIMTGFSWLLYIQTDFLQSLYIMTEMMADRIYNDWFRIRNITYILGEKGITKFHKSLNDRGHKFVPKSKRPLFRGGPKPFVYEYYHGVLLGNKFWTFGKYGRNKNIYMQFLNSGENLFRLKAGCSEKILTWHSLSLRAELWIIFLP